MKGDFKYPKDIRVREANHQLMEAARLGDIGGIRAALAKGADDLTHALLEAIQNECAQAVGYLIDNGANINISEDLSSGLTIKK